MVEILSVKQVAGELGISPQRVRQLIAEGQIEATKLGHQYAILRRDLLRFSQKRRPTGRPRKTG